MGQVVREYTDGLLVNKRKLALLFLSTLAMKSNAPANGFTTAHQHAVHIDQEIL